MPVLINFKICDNSSECSGIAVCKTGALSWDEKKKTIVIDNKKCISCGLCEKACMVNAIKVAKTPEEYKKIEQEIKQDTRKISDLFVDRYGAQPIHEAFLIREEKFNLEVEQSSRLTITEIFKNETIMCLLASIPIKELFENENIKYRKVELTTDNLLKRYKIKELPALLFFKDGKLIGKIEGYYKNDEKDEIKRKINKILK